MTPTPLPASRAHRHELRVGRRDSSLDPAEVPATPPPLPVDQARGREPRTTDSVFSLNH